MSPFFIMNKGTRRILPVKTREITRRQRTKLLPEYRQLLEILKNVDLELASGVSLDVAVEKIVEAEVRVRAKVYSDDYLFFRDAYYSRNKPDEIIDAGKGQVAYLEKDDGVLET